jgi:malate dehydrogenase (oxaloacetate-decarboxylating)
MTSTEPLYIRHSGPALLETPLLNKGSAFSREERIDFNLTGLLPPRYETISEQLDRAYRQYSSYHEAINKHIYLRGIQDNNETRSHSFSSWLSFRLSCAGGWQVGRPMHSGC